MADRTWEVNRKERYHRESVYFFEASGGTLCRRVYVGNCFCKVFGGSCGNCGRRVDGGLRVVFETYGNGTKTGIGSG